jgi:uncharacterized protein
VQDTPIDLPAILGSFGGEVRLFPLPNLVLFPDGFAPLKVFEDRYVSMVQDALADDGLIAMALLQPGWETDYQGNPEIHPVVCIGKILRSKSLPSGKYDVLLYGLVRARIVEEIASYPYRRATVEILDDVAPTIHAEEIARNVRRALDLVPGRKSVIWEMRRMANQLRGIDSTAGRYADAVANASDLPKEALYEVLAEPDVLQRFELLIGHLESRAAEGAPAVPDGGDPRWN